MLAWTFVSPPASDASIALRCRGLVKRYGEVLAVAGLDLDVRRGECFGMLGPNGAGKTTTVEIFEGLRVPDAGEVEVLGDRWHGDGLALRVAPRHPAPGDEVPGEAARARGDRRCSAASTRAG